MESFYSLKTGLNCYVVIEVIGMFRFTFYLHFFVGLNFLFGKFPKTVQQVSVIRYHKIYANWQSDCFLFLK